MKTVNATHGVAKIYTALLAVSLICGYCIPGYTWPPGTCTKPCKGGDPYCRVTETPKCNLPGGCGTGCGNQFPRKVPQGARMFPTCICKNGYAPDREQIYGPSWLHR